MSNALRMSFRLMIISVLGIGVIQFVCDQSPVPSVLADSVLADNVLVDNVLVDNVPFADPLSGIIGRS
jgi:hypothetical protein